MNSDFSDLTPKVVLGIAAHPDDLDVGSGGTMATFAAMGADVHYLILTDGSKGSEDKTITSDELINIRHQEQKNALSILGGKNITFLDYPDGGLEVTLELKKQIVKVIRSIRPDVVVTMDPTVVYAAERGIINHPDHRAAGQAALDAVFPLARDHLSFPELYEGNYEPHKVATVLLTNFTTNNFAVDITAAFDKKIKALQAHASQFGQVDADGWVRQMAAGLGQANGYELAEAFVRIDVGS